MISISIPSPKLGEKSVQSLHWEWFKGKFNRIQNKRKRDGILKHVLGITESDLETLVIKPFDDNDFIRVNNSIIARINNHKKHPSHKRWIKSIEKIFKCDDFIKNEGTWNSYTFFKKMGINVCPYCNRMYTFTVDENKATATKKGNATETVIKVTAPEIDHFFPQSDFPHLACSIYNFIPSCKICNHVKSNHINNIVYPYKEGFDKEGSFRIYCDESTIFSNQIDNINIKIRKTTAFSSNQAECTSEKEKCTRISNSVKLFHLTKIYENHETELNDLLNRYRNYSHPKIKDILHLFHADELKNLKIETKLDEKQIDAILELYARKMKNLFLGLPLGAGDKQYPLRKFKEDIIEQLDETAKKMKEKTKASQYITSKGSSPT